MIKQQISIAPTLCRKPGMKIISYLTRPLNTDAFRQKRIATAHPGRFWAHGRSFKMHDLSKRMHAGICTPSSMHSDRFSSDPGQGQFQRILYTAA